MSLRIITACLMFIAGCIMTTAAFAAETLIYADSFQQSTLAPEWEVHDGQWKVEDGALTVRDGGIISLKKLPGSSFAMEFEIAFPTTWVSVIPMFTSPDDYATLYFGGGYWESFQISGTDIEHYIQNPDPEITHAGGFKKMRVICDYGIIKFFYDGKEKGPVNFSFRPGARIGFRSLPGSGPLRIRNFRLTTIQPSAYTVTESVPPEQLAKGVLWKDLGLQGKPGETSELLNVDRNSGQAVLSYTFSSDPQFESCFARIPITAQTGNRLMMEIEGDNSRNNFFVIVHDVSGEQHLIMKNTILWKGWQDISIDLKPFLDPPPPLQRLAIHWGGDGNQVIDYPITAIDIGITKRVSNTATGGQLRLRNVRFVMPGESFGVQGSSGNAMAEIAGF